MPETPAHPSREKLSAYSLGNLSTEEATAIESHIFQCEPCCDTILSLSSDDTFVDLLKEAKQLPNDSLADVNGSAPTQSHQEGVPQELAEHPRYKIIRLIGKGGMGDVYEAIHRKMERRVALKVISQNLFRKTEAINRFHREVKTAAQLSHANIVASYDADQAGDFHFLVMEYVDGVDLSRIVSERGALPVVEACDFIRQAATGLQHAHELGMVHRDIKPHNLMVTGEGTVKILDFGLASLTPEASSSSDAGPVRSDLTAAGTIMGTPDYISPEQANDAQHVDIRSDIYSLGATFYYLLSGRVPFTGGSPLQKLRSHAETEPDALDKLRDDLPTQLSEIVTKMMAKDPNQRYLTPSEVATALESFLKTWQPGEPDLPSIEQAGGGDIWGNDKKPVGTGDGNPDWSLILARVLFAVAFLPTALMCYEWVSRRDSLEVAAQHTWAYMNTTLLLSTVAGIAYGIHRFRRQLRNDDRVYRWTPTEAVAIAVVLITGFFLFLPPNGSARKPVDPLSAFLTQFRAAESIRDQANRDKAFAKLATDAASAGDVEMTRRALDHVVSRELESPARRDSAIALFRVGQQNEALSLAESIYYQSDRDAALMAFSNDQKIETKNPDNRPTETHSVTSSKKAAADKPDTTSEKVTADTLPLVRVLPDAEGLTAKRVRIFGTFLVTDDRFGVRTYRISTASETLPPPPSSSSRYSDDELTFLLSLEEENFPNIGQYHSQRVLVTGLIYYFPPTVTDSAEIRFMLDGIQESP